MSDDHSIDALEHSLEAGPDGGVAWVGPLSGGFPKPLSRRATSAILWSFASQFARQGVQLATTITLARLLSPFDFGLVDIALILIGFVMLFKDLGTASAIVQRQSLSEGLLSSIFWFNVLAGGLVTLALILAAPLIGLFFHEARVVPVLSLLSAVCFLSSLGLSHQAILQRDLFFRKLAKIEIIASSGGAIAGIAAALLGAGVWSLVYQSVITAAVSAAGSWMACSWRPKKMFRWSELKKVSRYSLNLTGFNFFNYFSRNADNALIGRSLGAQQLAYYALAYRILVYPLQVVSGVIGRVIFPLYAKLQGDNERFRRTYLKVIGAIALVTFPMMCGLMVLARPFVQVVFGPQWEAVIVLLVIFAPVGLIQSIGTTVGAIYESKGRTDWILWWGVGTGMLWVLSFFIGIRWGICGVAIAYAIVAFMVAVPNLAVPYQLIQLRLKEAFSVLVRPFICSVLMGLALWGFKTWLFAGASPILALSALVPIGIAVYCLCVYWISREQAGQVLRLLFGSL